MLNIQMPATTDDIVTDLELSFMYPVRALLVFWMRKNKKAASMI